jgi:histidyl-tRNA synthetase
MIEPQIPKGFRDFLPQQMILRREIMRTMSAIFEQYGFVPLDTPCLEYARTLEGKYGEEGDKLIYRFEDRGGRAVALRYDLTIPLARVAAMHQQIPKPFKRYQIAPVWRADKPQKGRFREFYQCDIDIIGASGACADAELLLVAHAVLQALGFDNYLIRINNRKILNALAERLGIESARIPEFLRSLDKLDKAGPEAVLQEMQAAQLLSSDAETIVRDHLLSEGDNFEAVAALVADNETGADGLRELELITRVLEADGVDERYYKRDISLARGLDYYTGPIFEVVVREPRIGSILGGGRYDDLIGLFSKQSIPATGISFGLERLVTVMEELGMTGQKESLTQVMVTQFSEDLLTDGVKLAAQLRRAGLNTELYSAPAKLKKQMSYAAGRGIPFVVVLGPDEAAEGRATLKNMETGEQELLPQQDLPAAIHKILI